MSVVNIAFELEPEIAEGLATGVLKLFGGVVRDQSGHIVRHLPEAFSIVQASEQSVKEVAIVAKETTKAMSKSSETSKAITTATKKASTLFGTIGQLVKAHPIGTGIFVAVTTSAVYGVYRWCKGRKEQKDVGETPPIFVQSFNIALENYYNAITAGTLNEVIVTDLISAIENMKSALTKGRLTIELTTTQVKNILGVLEYYTKEFAGANNYEYTEPQMAETDDTVSNLVHIENFLKIQQKIYQAA